MKSSALATTTKNGVRTTSYFGCAIGHKTGDKGERMHTYKLFIQVRVDAYTRQNLTVMIVAENAEQARKAYECPAIHVFDVVEVGKTFPPAWEVTE